jgi:hypothetical protein
MGLMLKKILHCLDLPCHPTLVGIQLPKKTLLLDERQRGSGHLHFSLPELSNRFSVNMHTSRKSPLKGI